jgi:hypothetical protein
MEFLARTATRSSTSRSNAVRTFASRFVRSRASCQVMVRESCTANSPSGVSAQGRSRLCGRARSPSASPDSIGPGPQRHTQVNSVLSTGKRLAKRVISPRQRAACVRRLVDGAGGGPATRRQLSGGVAGLDPSSSVDAVELQEALDMLSPGCPSCYPLS